LTQIERRQARIRRIRQRYQKEGKSTNEKVANVTDSHHVIGKSQNHPENIPLFLQKHAGDPGVKVCCATAHFRNTYDIFIHLQDFLPKLKDHILPRIRALLQQEAISLDREPLSSTSNVPEAGLSARESGLDGKERDFVFFKDDRMYKHQLIRINYTTYDVRRSQDVINPNTSHRDIMLLANFDDTEAEPSPDSESHRFLYARVLGIYHVNVIYTGPGMLDYRPRRLDFLWVRNFQYVGRSRGWEDCTLDHVRFPPAASDGAFDFVDPNDVLRGSHIIPAFKLGKRHQDQVGLSRCAGDSQDWGGYSVDR
jgi:hypothetical protein